MKKLIFSLTLLFLFGLISSCTDCKECCIVTRIDGEVVEESDCANYCGEEVTRLESEEALVVGNQTSEWECTF